jgi:hypothetical protein
MTPAGSTAFILENNALKAEIKRMTKQVMRYQTLCARAADLLEELCKSPESGLPVRGPIGKVITELREASKSTTAS